jgi:biopolymer transport protein ExbD
MSKFSPPQPEESVSVNVVPLVDIMFLLLLFLMIGGDMSHRESTELQLPAADKAVEADRESSKEDRYAVINIHPLKDSLNPLDPTYRDLTNWSFAIGGEEHRDYFELLEKLKVIADTKREAEAVAGVSPPKYLSAVKISIRADKSSPYAMIQLAMTACAMADLYKIEVGAAKPAK